jgi:uncharacterized membrane protein
MGFIGPVKGFFWTVVFLGYLVYTLWLKHRKELLVELAAQERKGRGRGWGKVLTIILTVILTIAFLGALAALGYTIAVPERGEKFSEFYILGLSGKAGDYPSRLRVGEEGQVIIGIVNQEQEVTIYRVEVKVEGNLVREIGPLQLDHGEKWQQVVGFTLDKPGSKQKVEFLLYKSELKELYRSLHLWVDAW